MDADVAESLDLLLRSWADERDLAGAVLVSRGGDTLFEGCYGPADRASGAPVTPRTRFGTASVTKMFTAATVVDLVRRGELDRFDRPVVDLVAPERRPSTLRDDVTVHHLLTHTSGIADYAEEDEDSPGYVEDYGALWRDRPCSVMERPADFLPLYGDLPPYRAPGERFHYSNAGFVLLAQVVEDVTGRPFTDVVQERLFDAVGMGESGFFRSDEAVPDVAVGYLPRTSPDAPWRGNVFQVPVVGGGDGGAHVTTRDAARFLAALADGSLLGPLTGVALRPHADVGDGWSYGYGVYLSPDGWLGHGGGDPGVEARLRHHPADGTSVVVLCSVEGLSGDVVDEVTAALG